MLNCVKLYKHFLVALQQVAVFILAPRGYYKFTISGEMDITPKN